VDSSSLFLGIRDNGWEFILTWNPETEPFYSRGEPGRKTHIKAKNKRMQMHELQKIC
jgi:hypothetical protein